MPSSTISLHTCMRLIHKKHTIVLTWLSKILNLLYIYIYCCSALPLKATIIDSNFRQVLDNVLWSFSTTERCDNWPINACDCRMFVQVSRFY